MYAQNNPGHRATPGCCLCDSQVVALLARRFVVDVLQCPGAVWLWMLTVLRPGLAGFQPGLLACPDLFAGHRPGCCLCAKEGA